MQEETEDIHKEITELYNLTEGAVQTHTLQSSRRWPGTRSPHGPWSRDGSPLKPARRHLHGTDVSGSPKSLSQSEVRPRTGLSQNACLHCDGDPYNPARGEQETRRRMEVMRDADKSDDDESCSVDELLRETWQQQELLDVGRPSHRHPALHDGSISDASLSSTSDGTHSDYDSDPMLPHWGQRSASATGGGSSYVAPQKQKQPTKRKSRYGVRGQHIAYRGCACQ